MIGGLSGPATELNPGLIFARRANVQGISVGSMQMFEALSRAITANGIKPVLDKVFAFDEAPAAGTVRPLGKSVALWSLSRDPQRL